MQRDEKNHLTIEPNLLDDVTRLTHELAQAQAKCGTLKAEAHASVRAELGQMETEIARRTAELRKSEERFSRAMRGANDGLWDWDLSTDAVYYSPRWKSMLGYQDDELPHHLDTWKSLVHPDDKERVLETIQTQINNHADSFKVEMRMQHKEGHEIVVLSRGFMVYDEVTHKPERIVGTHLDITSRSKSEQFILATSKILKMIATREPASQIYDAIALLYESRHPGMRCSMLILEGNKLMHAGAPSLPKAYCDAVNGLENGPSVGSCGTATYWGKRVLVENIATDPKWEKIKHVALPHGMRCCWSEPIKNSKGEVLGAFGMYYNHPALPNDSEASDLASAARLAGIIMEREKSETELNTYKHHLEELVAKRTKQLEETKKEAEEANYAKSKFLSNMSHELRTPLNAIIGFGQLLLSDPGAPLTPQQQESISQILKSGEHLLELITEILNLAQIEAGRLTISLKPIRLDHTIHEAVELVQSFAGKYGVTVACDLPQNMPSHTCVLADQLRLKQILLNLLSNGIKYNQPGGSVTVRVQPGTKHHSITVADTGIGFEPKDIHNIFEPFNRLGAETKNIEGTGIGLAITKRLVEIMSGTLDIKSSPGHGSSFTVSLPAAEPEREASTGNSSNHTGSEHNAPARIEKTVLYIEDNLVNIKLVEQILRRRPQVRLLTATTGQQGIDLALRENPALILMDMQLPDMTGIEALREIRKNEIAATIPVVGVSANAMPEVVSNSVREGFMDYITKPFNIDRLLKAIDNVLAFPSE